MSDEKLSEILKIRTPPGLVERLKKIAKFRRTKYAFEARRGIEQFLDSEEEVIREQRKAKAA